MITATEPVGDSAGDLFEDLLGKGVRVHVLPLAETDGYFGARLMLYLTAEDWNAETLERLIEGAQWWLWTDVGLQRAVQIVGPDHLTDPEQEFMLSRGSSVGKFNVHQVHLHDPDEPCDRCKRMAEELGA